MTRPWELDGPNNSPVRECDRALARLHRAEDRPPTEDDRPPVSTLPMTRGARVALELGRRRGKSRRVVAARLPGHTGPPQHGGGS